MNFGWAEIGSVVGVLSILIGGVWTLLRALMGNESSRASLLAKREREHDEEIDRRLKEQRQQIELLEAKLALTERHFAALVTAFTLLIDQFIANDTDEATLAALTLSLRATFPLTGEVPPQLASLLARLDARMATKGAPDAE